MRYKGKEVCQGCGLSGNTQPRREKEMLCDDCMAIFAKGQAEKRETEQKWVSAFLHHHAYYDKEVNRIAHALLKSFSNKYKDWEKRIYDISGIPNGYKGSNGASYTIPEELVEPFEEHFRALNERFYKLILEERERPSVIAESLKEEKNRIFNEGVEKGRQLLLQLNQDGMSMKDFEATIKKY